MAARLADRAVCKGESWKVTNMKLSLSAYCCCLQGREAKLVPLCQYVRMKALHLQSLGEEEEAADWFEMAGRLDAKLDKCKQNLACVLADEKAAALPTASKLGFSKMNVQGGQTTSGWLDSEPDLIQKIKAIYKAQGCNSPYVQFKDEEK